MYHRILLKTENAVYRLQIPALVPEILKFEKTVKYANEMTDDVIHSTQILHHVYKSCYLGQFAVQTIETWQANSSTENTPAAINWNILFPRQLTLFQSPPT